MPSFARTMAVLAVGLSVPLVLPSAHAQQNAQQNGSSNGYVYPQLRNELQRAQQNQQGIPLLPAMDIVGRNVVDRNGDNVGPVNSLIIDSRNGVVEYVLIAANDTYSPNGDLIALPWSALQQPGGRGVLALNVAGQRLMNAPHVNANAVAEIGNPAWRNHVYGYWGMQYPYYGTSAWYAPYRAWHPYARNNGNNAGTVGSGNANTNGAHGQNDNQTNGSRMGYTGNQQNQQTGNNQQGSYGPPIHDLQVNNNGIVSMLRKSWNVQPNEMQGVNVYAQNGNTIGQINQVMIDTRSGHVAYVLVERSGFLGLNPVWYPVPIQAMQWTRNANGNGNHGNGPYTANGYPNRGYAGGYWGGYYGSTNSGWQLTVNTQALNYLPPVPVNESNLTRYAPQNDLDQLYQAFDIQPYWNQG